MGSIFMEAVNWIAIAACGVATLVLGSLWYSPLLFNKVWMREAGVSMEAAQSMNMPLTIGATLVIGVVAAFVFALFVGAGQGVENGLIYGFSAGLFWVAGFTGINCMWARKSFKLFLIDGAYQTVQFTIYGGLIGWLQ
jgi:hypothetical protein